MKISLYLQALLPKIRDLRGDGYNAGDYDRNIGIDDTIEFLKREIDRLNAEELGLSAWTPITFHYIMGEGDVIWIDRLCCKGKPIKVKDNSVSHCYCSMCGKQYTLNWNYFLAYLSEEQS